MSERKIKIYVIYPSVDNLEKALQLLRIRDLPFTKDFVWDEENPDYIVATDMIYAIPECAEKFIRLAYHTNKSPVIIFYTGEAISPDFNISDYGVCWNWNFSYMDRVIRRSEYALVKRFSSEITIEEAKALLKGKKRFCSFLYSNGEAHPMRDKLFQAVSGYKHVDSLGQHMNNVGTLISSGGGGGEEEKIDMSIKIKSHYKFSIASENACYEGYTSEKLITSLAARTVPIYWGNPYIAEEFNQKAFVNCNDYDSLDDIVKRVKEIDEDDNLWAYMVSQP